MVVTRLLNGMPPIVMTKSEFEKNLKRVEFCGFFCGEFLGNVFQMFHVVRYLTTLW